MSQVACPHCGFLNFSISAYCGRCERPLLRQELKPVEHLRTPVVPTAAPVAPVKKPPLTPPPMPVRPRISVSSSEPEIAKTPSPTALPDEIPLTAASLPQLVLARLVDLSLVIGVGALTTIPEVLIFSQAHRSHVQGGVDKLAEWIYWHADATTHGLVVAVVFACAYGLRAGRRGGKTLGRALTGTVLVRRSGRPLSWPLLLLRMVLAGFSTLFFGTGFFWALVDRHHRTWHDLVCGTLVVRDRVAVAGPIRS